MVLTGDPNPILVIRDDPLLLQDLIQLRPSPMQDHGVKPQPVQEGQRERQILELVGEDGTSDLEDGEFGLGEDAVGG